MVFMFKYTRWIFLILWLWKGWQLNPCLRHLLCAFSLTNCSWGCMGTGEAGFLTTGVFKNSAHQDLRFNVLVPATECFHIHGLRLRIAGLHTTTLHIVMQQNLILTWSVAYYDIATNEFSILHPIPMDQLCILSVLAESYNLLCLPGQTILNLIYTKIHVLYLTIVFEMIKIN
jgi:hypothetical protein